MRNLLDLDAAALQPPRQFHDFRVRVVGEIQMRQRIARQPVHADLHHDDVRLAGVDQRQLEELGIRLLEPGAKGR